MDKGTRIAFSHRPFGVDAVGQVEQATVVVDDTENGTLLVALDPRPPAELSLCAMIRADDPTIKVIKEAGAAARARAEAEAASALRAADDAAKAAADAAAKAKAKLDALNASAPADTKAQG